MGKLIYKIKNWKLRLREKFHYPLIFHFTRCIKMFITSPQASIRQGFLKIMFGLTYRCQCKCIYCCSGRYPVNEKEELMTQEVKRILKEISVLPSLFTVVSFFGGEPLLREDIFELIKYANNLGLFTEVETNGILLSKDNVVKLKKAGLHHIFIRLESSNPEIHDKLSNYDGCFERAMEGINNCIREKLACTISTIALKEKIYNGDLEKIIDIGKRLKVTSIRVLYPTLAGNWTNERSQLLNAEEKARIGKLLEPDFIYLESTYSANKNIGRICPSLQKKFFYISPYGEIQPCPFVPLKFGNIRLEKLDNLLKKMWYVPLFYCENNLLCFSK